MRPCSNYERVMNFCFGSYLDFIIAENEAKKFDSRGFPSPNLIFPAKNPVH
jgi:hypothetical protein